MALFNNKEFETLQTENTELKAEVSSLRIQLNMNGINLIEANQMIEKLSAEVERFNSKRLKNISSHQVENACQNYINKISKLEKEIDALQNRPHNERGAGRKHKATPEQSDYIISLFSQGISQNKIAKIMTEQTGDKWNKTTIRNIIIRSKN